MRILNSPQHDRAYVEMAGRSAAARSPPPRARSSEERDWLAARMVARMTKTHGGVSSVANEKAAQRHQWFSGGAGADGRPRHAHHGGGRKNGSAGGAAHIGGIANAGGVAHSGGAAKAGGSAAGGSACARECERNCVSRARTSRERAARRGAARARAVGATPEQGE